MSYAADIARFRANLETRLQDVTVASALKVHESIVAGSALTGSPGQQVDTGYLRSSFQLGIGGTPAFRVKGDGSDAPPKGTGTPTPPPPPQFVGGERYKAEIVTNVRYAEYIEEGLRGQKSTVGGPGSVKLTRAAWGRIVAESVREQGGR